MKYIMFVLLLCFCTFSVHGQHTLEFDIQYLTLNNSFLVNEIETLIKEQEHSDEKNNLFKKGLGYIRLDINRFSPDSDTLRSYTISPELNSMKEHDSDEFYPPFYSYVGDRIVLIYMKGLDMFSNLQFSNKSKRTLRNMLEPFLEKPKKVKAYDEEGNLVIKDDNFRVDYFWLHGAKNIFILKNKPPVVKKGKY